MLSLKKMPAVMLGIFALVSSHMVQSLSFESNYNPYVDESILKSDESFGSGESCKAINERVDVPSEVYTIAPFGVSKDVYCDMETFGGGWTLLYSFGRNPVSQAALLYGGINSAASLARSGLTYSMTHINLAKYGVSEDALQIFYSGEERGYLELSPPSFASQLRLDMDTMRYDGSISVLRNGINVLTISRKSSREPVFMSILPGDKIRVEEEGILWMSSIWVR